MPNSITGSMPQGVSCQRCGSSHGVYERAGPHIKLSCAECTEYVKFVPKVDLPSEFVRDVLNLA